MTTTHNQDQPATKDYSALGFSEHRLARIKPAMAQFINNNAIAGAITLIARYGELVHLQCHGYADVATQKAIAPDTLFRLYSMTKPVTAVAVMMLYEEGLLALDDPIEQYLPCFAAMKVLTNDGLVDAQTSITIRQLLTHNSGLTYSMIPDELGVADIYGNAGVNEIYQRLTMTLEEHVESLASQPLLAQPGTAWIYSESISVLARLVEVLSGLSFDDFLQQNILVPLGMTDTTHEVAEENRARLATLYEQTPDLAHFQVTDKYGGDYCKPAKLKAGGVGLVSTAADYLKFAQMLLNQGELDGVQILSPFSVRLIMSDQFAGKFEQYLPEASIAGFKGMGHGFAGTVVTDAIKRGCYGSTGEYSWSGWASTRFWLDPKEQLIGIVLTQLIPHATSTSVLGLSERFRQMTYQAMIHSELTVNH